MISKARSLLREECEDTIVRIVKSWHEFFHIISSKNGVEITRKWSFLKEFSRFRSWVFISPVLEQF
jgi:hypothetical protein